MQDRRQLCFILGLIGAIFAIGSGLMTAVMSLALFGALPMPAENAPPMGLFLGMFAWLALTGVVGGVVMLVGSLRMRTAEGPAARSAAILTIVGGGISILGGNVLAAGLGIAGGAVRLSDAPAAQPSA